MSAGKKRALVIVFDGVEEIEALTPVDILRRADVEVTIASVDGSASVTGRNDITFSADTSLSLIDPADYDLVFLPGGPGVLEQTGNRALSDLLIAHNSKGRELAAICAAPKLLAHCGILNSRTATSHASVRHELPSPSDDAIVEDGNLTTSQGVGTAVDFALTLVRRLKGKDAAEQIAESIHRQ